MPDNDPVGPQCLSPLKVARTKLFLDLEKFLLARALAHRSMVMVMPMVMPLVHGGIFVEFTGVDLVSRQIVRSHQLEFLRTDSATIIPKGLLFFIGSTGLNGCNTGLL